MHPEPRNLFCEFHHARTWELLVPAFPLVEMAVSCTVEKSLPIAPYTIPTPVNKSIHTTLIAPANYHIIPALNEVMFAKEAFCLICRRADNSELYKNTLFHDCRLLSFETTSEEKFKLLLFSLDMEYLN